MNKYKKLTKKLSLTAAIGVGVMGLFGGLYYLTDSLAVDSENNKTQAESELTNLQSGITSLRTQLEKSGQVEQSFAKIQLERTNPDFSANSDMLKDFLRSSKWQYRFSNSFKLTITPEEKTDKVDLSELHYNIMVRPKMKVEFEAMSDLHVFSFLRAFTRQAPGLLRINTLTMNRKSDMDATAISDMQRGGAPYLVDGSIEFDWVGVTDPQAKAPVMSVTPAVPPQSGEGQ